MKQHIISTRGFTRQQWLENRRGGIGGSDVAAILGMSPWRSPYQVWADKTGRLAITDEGNEFTHWGNIMEPILAHEFEDATGKKVYRQNKTYCHPEFDFLRANIDRDIAGEPGFLEIKTAMVDHRPILVKGDPGPTGKTTLVDCLRSLGIQAFEPFEFEEINIEKG